MTMHRIPSLRLARLAAFNLCAMAGLFSLWIDNWIMMAVDGDATKITLLIAALFIVGLIISARRAFGGDIRVIRQIANSLVMLGLIGTVIGFIIALSGVDPASASDINAISGMISTLITGIGVALYTTLAGSVFSLWLTVNYNILHG